MKRTLQLYFRRIWRYENSVKNEMVIEIPIPESMAGFTLPPGVMRRLKALLDRQDDGKALTGAERREAEGLVEMAEFLSLLKLRAKRVSGVA